VGLGSPPFFYPHPSRKKEWSDLIEVIVSGYVEGMAKMADDEVPF